MEFASLVNSMDDQHNSVGLVKISKYMRCRTHFSLEQNRLAEFPTNIFQTCRVGLAVAKVSVVEAEVAT